MSALYWQDLANSALLNVILVYGLYLTMLPGQTSVCHGALMGIGAYAVGVATTKLGVPFYAAVALGPLSAGIVGLIIAYPVLRLSGLYLAIATLFFGELVVSVLNNAEMLGGARGLSGIPMQTSVWVTMGCAAVVGAAVVLLERTPTLLRWRAVGSHEQAAVDAGMNVASIRRAAFFWGASVAGLAGALHAGFYTTISPSDFGFTRSVEPLLFLAIGGIRSPVGAAVGAVVLTVVPEALHFAEVGRMALVSVVLLVIMAFRARGLVSWRPALASKYILSGRRG